jgi:hypothetical protein
MQHEGRIRKPRRFPAPFGEFSTEPEVTQALLPGIVPGLLKRQRLVKNEPAATGEPAHFSSLVAVWHELEFVSLNALHLC